MSDTNKYQKKILTIPNVLSFVRICLIPVIIWLYLGKQDYFWTTITVLFSGLTDIVDGTIARKFNMISDVGKVLDPVADKATQFVVAILLTTRFPLMILPIIVGAVKEIFMAVSGYLVVKKCDIVLGSHWHGKLATVMLTGTIALHLFWIDINSVLSTVLIIISTASIILSLTMYAIRNIRYLTGKIKAE